MVSKTNDKIILIQMLNGIYAQTFKNTEDLLMAIISQYFNEQMGNFEGIAMCHLSIKRKIHNRLEEIIKSYTNESEEVCPVSGAKIVMNVMIVK